MPKDRPAYKIVTNKRQLDVDLIHRFLSTSYWAKGIPRRLVTRSIQHSLCFGVFLRGKQVGFARVITDRATFAYLADVFIVPEHRGRGAGKFLVEQILKNSNLQELRRFLLATLDAHTLYAQFGFKTITHPERFMTIHVENPYKNVTPSKH